MVTKQSIKPAAKKTTAKSQPPGTWAKVILPAGFRAITSGAYGEEWEYEEHPLLQGTTASAVREVETGKGKDRRVSRVVTVKSNDDGKSYTVWESASLRAFFDHLRLGQQVAIAFHGYKDVGRPQPMKVFEGAFTEEDAEAVGSEAQKTIMRKLSQVAAKKTRR